MKSCIRASGLVFLLSHHLPTTAPPLVRICLDTKYSIPPIRRGSGRPLKLGPSARANAFTLTKLNRNFVFISHDGHQQPTQLRTILAIHTAMSDAVAENHDKTVEGFMSAMYVHRVRECSLLQLTAKFSAADNSRNSWFLRLPAELRNRVYHYALSDGILDIRYDRQDYTFSYEPIAPSGISLLRICRQVRHETVSLPLRLITHRFVSLSSFHQYIRSIPITTRNALSSIVVGIYFSWRGLPVMRIEISSMERTATTMSELCPGVQSVLVHLVMGPDHQRGDELTRLAEIRPLTDWLSGGSREKPHVEVKFMHLLGV